MFKKEAVLWQIMIKMKSFKKPVSIVRYGFMETPSQTLINKGNYQKNFTLFNIFLMKGDEFNE